MKKQNISAPSTLSTIKRKLRKGEVTQLAIATNYSVSHVTNVLAGRKNNASIVKAAHNLTRRRK